MANFNESYRITRGLEGGYANDPLDNGGETYCGISRKFHPALAIWAIIDNKPHPIKWNTIFKALESRVRAFFIQEFWQKLYLDYIKQSLANQLFDFAVNSGKGRAVKELQTALNSFGERLKVDGAIGRNTLAAISRHDSDTLAKNLHARRTLFIKEEAKEQPHYSDNWNYRLSVLKSHLPSVFGVGFGLAALTTVFF
jgi:lysozyme family protein